MGLLGFLLLGSSYGVGAQAVGGGESKTEVQDQAKWEGAVGLLAHHAPSYSGAADLTTRLNPAGFLRWGRWTLTGAGGFTTSRKDEVDRGLGAELVRTSRLQLKLGLRFDNGRSESDSTRLTGLGDVKRTIRARLSARWDLDEDWRLTAGISADAANRGGGYFVDASAARAWQLPGDSSLTLSVGLSAAGDRFMQTWYGITPEQSALSGMPVYAPQTGLRDAGVSLTWRSELWSHWAGFAGIGASQLLGPAAQSPLTDKAASWSASAGLVRRF